MGSWIDRGLAAPAVPTDWRRPLGWTAAIAALGLVALGIAVTGTSTASVVDDVLFTAAGGTEPGLWTKALAVDYLGEPVGVMVIASIIVVICIALHRWRLAVLTPAAQGAIWSTSTLTKPVVDRTIHGDHLAYPSGHTASTTAFALVVGLLLVSVLQLRRAVASIVLVGATVVGGLAAAWAQTILIAHYATDTLGGFLLALALVPSLGLLVDHLADRRLPAVPPCSPASAGTPTRDPSARTGPLDSSLPGGVPQYGPVDDC